MARADDGAAVGVEVSGVDEAGAHDIFVALEHDVASGSFYFRLLMNGVAAEDVHDISITYDLKFLLGIDQRLQRLETTGTYYGTWTDYRLAFDPSCAGVDHFHLPVAVGIAKLWYPHAFISNEILTDIPTAADTYSIRSDGRVEFTTMRRVTSKCSMNFRNMPYDKQRCDIIIKLDEDPSEVILVPAPAADRVK